jgi:hypothetical protein
VNSPQTWMEVVEVDAVCVTDSTHPECMCVIRVHLRGQSWPLTRG